MPSWLPRGQAQRLIWLQNFVLKLNVYVGTAGIVAGDVTTVTLYRDFYQWILNRSEQIGTLAQDINVWKSNLADGPLGTPLGSAPGAPVFPIVPAGTPVAGIFVLIVQLAERIRNTAGITQAILEDLGIVGADSVPVLDDPTFTVTSLPNSQERLDFVKSFSDGVLVESQVGDETTWTLLGTDRFSPYLDARPPQVAGVPEVRRYRIRYLDGDTPVGNYSAVVTVTTIP